MRREMAYKLIIVDDEGIIRDGLKNVVEWQSLGFEVSASMEDGRDAIEYIQKNPVDVVLTDIKMTFVSGLELAKYIYENKPEIRVIIISGYKEFEFAKQAISYNVTDYLLKPTEYDELVKVFNAVKHQLDSKLAERQRLAVERREHEELIPFARLQFFTDIITGALQDRTRIHDRLKLTGLDIDIEHGRCCILIVKIQHMDQYLKVNSNYSKDSLYTAVRNIINCEDNSIKYFSVYNEHDLIHVIAVALNVMTEATFKRTSDIYIGRLQENVKNILNMEITVDVNRISTNICEMAADNTQMNISGNEALQLNEYERLLEQQKLLISYIGSGSHEESMNVFSNIVDRLKSLDYAVQKNFFASLFMMLDNLLKEFGFEIFAVTKGNFNFKKIIDSSDLSDILPWCRDNLILIVDYIIENGGATEKQIISKAKEFILENYSKDISLEDVSEHVYLSSGYFSKLFKLHTEENYIDFLIRVRMDKAKELLRTTVYKAYDIGETVGYSNTKYFLRLFKKYTGLTPSEYRNMYNERGMLE